MRISEARFFLIAAGLHAALPVMAAIIPAPVLMEEATVPIEVQVEVEVEQTRPPTVVEMPAAARVESPRHAEEAPVPRPEQRPASASHIEPGPVPTVAPTGEPQAGGVPGEAPGVPGPAPTGTSEYTTPAPMVQTGPGSGLPGLGVGGPAWAIPGAVPDMGRPAPAPTTAPKATVDPKIATKVLNDVLKEKDKALGLDLPAGGKIASIVRAAVQSTDTPPESHATFEVKLSPTGQVLSVRVTSSNGGSAEVWKRAEAAVRAMAAGVAGGMTSRYAKGAMLQVSMTSSLTLPDGSKSAIQRKGVGATFDVANIGAHMQRSIKTSVSAVAIQ